VNGSGAIYAKVDGANFIVTHSVPLF